jgi:hypothetical protein
MLRALVLCAVLAAPLAAQEQGPPPPPDDALTGAELFDSVQLLVNSDCITHSDLLRLTWQLDQAEGGGGDMQQRFRESVTQLTRELLLEQGGRALGYPPDMIASYVSRQVKERKERVGSATALAEMLVAARKDSGMLRADTEGAVYRLLYERAITGDGEGPGGRPYVDNFVRPGRMSLEFRRQGSRLDLPPVVHLQEIIVAPGAGEDLGSARQRAFLVRSRAQRGEDFAALNREFGVATKRVGNDLVHETDLEPIEEPRLASRPEVLDFVRTAKPGDISEPLPATVAGGQIGGWRLLRLLERVEGVAQRFEDREFQEGLRARMLEERREYEVERALRRLMQAAYIWPPPPPRRPAGAGEPAAGDVPEPAVETPAEIPPAPPEFVAPPSPTRSIGAPEPEPLETEPVQPDAPPAEPDEPPAAAGDGR